jgi:hypothetical protein
VPPEELELELAAVDELELALVLELELAAVVELDELAVPPHDAPQAALASFTHCASHFVLQQ